MTKIPRIEIIDALFKQFDIVTEKALSLEEPDNYLINSYCGFRENIKEHQGTGANVTAISELLYVDYIKRKLEQDLSIEFKKKVSRLEKSSDSIYYFWDDLNNETKIIVTSGISIEKHFQFKLHPTSEIEPDLCILLKRKTELIPIAIFEIKIFPELNVIQKKINERFEKIKENLLSRKIEEPFFIFLLLGYKAKTDGRSKIFQELENFQSISKDKCRLMWNHIIEWTEETYNNEIIGSIKTIMNDVIAVIKNQL